MTAVSYSTYSAFFADSLKAPKAAVGAWTEAWRSGSDFALWWACKCAEAPGAFAAVAAPFVRRPETAVAEPATATVVDLAEAMAARAVATVEAVEPVAEAMIDAAEAAIEEGIATVEMVAEAALPDPDDLTRLVGIGPKLAAALAERGVTRFTHIAAWTEADLAELDKALDLKGRAVRDAWVAQAKRFCAEV